MISELRKECQQQAMTYLPFGYPLKYDKIEGTFTILEHSGLKFARPGISYLLYRLEKYLDKQEARELLKTSYAKFTEYINAARFEQAIQESWRQEQELIMAVNDNKIYGIMTKYEAISNASVLDLIEKQKLQNNITKYKLSIKEMNVFLRTGNHKEFNWGMNIRNGETGHVPLGYYVYIEREDYVFTFPFKNVRRHMSKVHEVPENMQVIFETIKEVELWGYINQQPSSDYTVQLYAQFEKLQPILDNYLKRGHTLQQLITSLLIKRKERGYKTICTQAVNKIMNKVSEEFNA